MVDGGEDTKGYDYKFIEEPRGILKCLICGLVAREPRQHTCGRLFCDLCIRRHFEKQNDNRCPYCKADGKNNTDFANLYFADKRSKEEIDDLYMKCPYYYRMCQWKGKLRSVHDHIEVCQVPCPNGCTTSSEGKEVKLVLSKELKHHLKMECPMREYKCMYCRKKGTFDYLKKQHETICPRKTYPCKGCGFPLLLHEISYHADVCEDTKVACSYASIGCDVIMKRKDIGAHEDKDDKHHLQIALKTLVRLQESVQTLAMKNLTRGTVTFTLTDYSRKMNDKGDVCEWSPTFHTREKGYSMFVTIYPKGRKAALNSHMTVELHFIRGPHHNELKWPFIGSVTFELLNQTGNKDHHAVKKKIERKHGIEAPDFRCSAHFISHDVLSKRRSPYVRNDTLYFRVTVEVHDEQKWLQCSTAH